MLILIETIKSLDEYKFICQMFKTHPVAVSAIAIILYFAIRELSRDD